MINESEAREAVTAWMNLRAAEDSPGPANLDWLDYFQTSAEGVKLFCKRMTPDEASRYAWHLINILFTPADLLAHKPTQLEVFRAAQNATPAQCTEALVQMLLGPAPYNPNLN